MAAKKRNAALDGTANHLFIYLYNLRKYEISVDKYGNTPMCSQESCGATGNALDLRSQWSGGAKKRNAPDLN